MTSLDAVARAMDGMTLEQFLAVPQEKPYQEFIDGRVSEKPGFTELQSVVLSRLGSALMSFALENAPHVAALLMLDHVHRSPGSERFFIPDLCLRERRELRALGAQEIVATPPPFVAEIVLAEHSAGFLQDRKSFYMTTGTQTAWFIDVDAGAVEVLRTGMASERFERGADLGILGILPGFEVSLDKLFDFDD